METKNKQAANTTEAYKAYLMEVMVALAIQDYQGGIIAYQNWIKEQYLDVTTQMIEEHDVVSREVVLQMAAACRQRFNTHYAIATTGYTGEGNQRIPSGTIYIGFAGPTSTKAIKLSLPNSSREDNTAIATQTAIREFLEWIENT